MIKLIICGTDSEFKLVFEVPAFLPRIGETFTLNNEEFKIINIETKATSYEFMSNKVVLAHDTILYLEKS